MLKTKDGKLFNKTLPEPPNKGLKFLQDLLKPETVIYTDSSNQLQQPFKNNTKINTNNMEVEEQEDEEPQYHTSAITGLHVSSSNRILISSSLDGTLKFWDFKSSKLLHSINIESPINRLLASPESELIAIATDSLTVQVYDSTTYQRIRSFKDIDSIITSMCFSPDSRLLLVSTLDCSLRIYDLPTARLIDWIKFSNPITSLTFSPAGDFIATTHANNVGIYLWANKLHFSANSVFLSSKATTKPKYLQLLANSNKDQLDDQIDEDNIKEEPEDETIIDNTADTDETNSEEEGINNNNNNNSGNKFGLITYSSLPASKWQNLNKLDLIRERNKPKEKPKQPEKAPFFLTQINLSGGPSNINNNNNIDTNMDLSNDSDTNGPMQRTISARRVIQSHAHRELSEFLTLIQNAKQTYNPISKPMAYSVVTDFLSKLSSSGLDAEIRALGLDPELESDEFELVLHYLLGELISGKNFEFIQAVMNLMLRVHGNAIIKYKSCKVLIIQLKTAQKQIWSKFQRSLNSNAAIVSTLANII